jgi:nucleoside phosphorylase
MTPVTDVADVVVSDKVSDDDDDVDARPKPKKKRNAAKKPSPRPVAKNSQRTKKLPDVASCDKGSSTQKSNQIRKFLLCAVAALTSIV